MAIDDDQSQSAEMLDEIVRSSHDLGSESLIADRLRRGKQGKQRYIR